MLLNLVTICAALVHGAMSFPSDEDYTTVPKCTNDLQGLEEYDLRAMCWVPMFVMFTSDDSSDVTCSTFIHRCPPNLPHVILDVTSYSFENPYGKTKSYNLTHDKKGVVTEKFWNSKGELLEYKVVVQQQYGDLFGGRIISYFLCSDHSVRTDFVRRSIAATNTYYDFNTQVKMYSSARFGKDLYAVPSAHCNEWMPWGRWPQRNPNTLGQLDALSHSQQFSQNT